MRYRPALFSVIILIILIFPIAVRCDDIDQEIEVVENDGPYLFIEKDSLKLYNIINGKIVNQTFQFKDDLIEIPINSLSATVSIIKKYPRETRNNYNDISKFLVISDLHGQFELFKQLMINNNIMNTEFKWIWDEGHLIINGDVFDRGESVTEALWLIYSLSQQAEEAGGRVHFSLGNHELMILENDLRYLHEKYFNAARLFDMEIEDMYNENSILGLWIRSLPVCVEINRSLIVHAGISPWLKDRYSNIDEINEAMYDLVNGTLKDSIDIDLLSGSYGPFWYRGYFTDHRKYDIIEEEILNEIFTYYDIDKMIVGHTTYDDLLLHFNNKLISIDAGIKNGLSGKALLWENGNFFRLDEIGNTSILMEKQR